MDSNLSLINCNTIFTGEIGMIWVVSCHCRHGKDFRAIQAKEIKDIRAIGLGKKFINQIVTPHRFLKPVRCFPNINIIGSQPLIRIIY